MSVTTYEGTVEDGQIKLSQDVQLPEHARAYVVVTGTDESRVVHIRTPRLADPRRAADFLLKVVVEEPKDAGLSG